MYRNLRVWDFHIYDRLAALILLGNLAMRFEISRSNFSPEPREVSKRNNSPVNKIALETFLGPNHTPSLASAYVQMTHFETWLHYVFQYLATYIDLLVCKVGHMLRPWNVLKKRLFTKILICDTIFNFRWCHQKLVSGLHNTPVTWPSEWHHQSSSLHKGNSWYKFQKRYQGDDVHFPLFWISCIVSWESPTFTHIFSLFHVMTSVF